MVETKQPSWVKKALNVATHPIIPGRFNDAQKKRLRYVRAGQLFLNENPAINPSTDEGRTALTQALSEQFPDFAKNNSMDVINDIVMTEGGVLGWTDSLSKVDGWQSGKTAQRN
jgi:hypothetical protein